MKYIIYAIVLSMLLTGIVQAMTSTGSGIQKIALFTTTYQRNVAYKTPEGTATIKFIIQKDGKGMIKSVKSVPVKGDSTSMWYMESFGKKISATVVGKSLKSLSIKSIGGASLTTNAFNVYIKTIK